MQLLVQLKADFLRTRIPLKTPRRGAGEQEAEGGREGLGWEAEEVAAAVAEALTAGVEVVVVGQEEVGLLPKTELGQGVGEVGEEVQVVLGQHLVSKRKQIGYIKNLEKKDLISLEILVLLLSE